MKKKNKVVEYIKLNEVTYGFKGYKQKRLQIKPPVVLARAVINGKVVDCDTLTVRDGEDVIPIDMPTEGWMS